MPALTIVALCIAAAVVYGIAHDQVTARVCVEYFTIGHPPIFGTESPTWLALGWGAVATWWCGLLLGIPLALIARLGTRPRLDARDLMRPIVRLLLVMGTLALVCGLTGYAAAQEEWVWLVEPLVSRVPRPAHARFLADLWAHLASYTAGFLGGIIVWVHAWRERRRRASRSVQPAPQA